MDIVTDITSQAVSFITTIQDICQKKGSEIRKTNDDNAYLWDIVDFTKIDELAAGSNSGDTFGQFKGRIQEIIWSSTGDKETHESIQCFFRISEDLLLKLKEVMNETGSQPDLQERQAGYGSLHSSPYQWRCFIRRILYKFPKKRIEFVQALHYMPIQIVLCLGGANLSSYKQRLYQIYKAENAFLLSGSDKEKNKNWWDMRKDLAGELLEHDHMLLSNLLTTDNAVPFETFYIAELDEIASRRKAIRKDKEDGLGGDTKDVKTGDPLKRAQEMELVGLALSGGGIRSASFNLGVIQQLAERDHLARIDYLSTVSGGGYIGSWLVSWIIRAGSLKKVSVRLNSKKSAYPVADELRPVRWLRMYSNYLAPDSSIMSADSWTMGITWLRNTVINQIILLFLLCTSLSCVWVLYHLWIYLSEARNVLLPGNVLLWSSVLLVPGALLAGWGINAYYPNMPTDIREYHFKNSSFPNQTTADQFFDENQFESYRKLGYHALDGVKVF